MHRFKEDDYRQIIENPHIKKPVTDVRVGKYVLAHKSETEELKTLLGSCVGLAGYLRGWGFLTHLRIPQEADGLIHQLRNDIRFKVGCTLEDFHLTMTGGSRIMIKSAVSPGELNIDAMLNRLRRCPDHTVHLGKDTGNIIQLSLRTGILTSKIIHKIEILT